MNIKTDRIQSFELLSSTIAKEPAESVLMEKTKVFAAKHDIFMIQREMNSNLKWMNTTE